VARFDRIVVLAAGAIVGDGSLADLRRSCVVFSHLFADQIDQTRTARGANSDDGGSSAARPPV
jgi:hypothetical protein